MQIGVVEELLTTCRRNQNQVFLNNQECYRCRYMYVHILTCTCTCTCSHVYMYVYVHILTCVHVRAHSTCTCTCSHVYMYVHMLTCVHVRAHSHMCTCTCTCSHVYLRYASKWKANHTIHVDSSQILLLCSLKRRMSTSGRVQLWHFFIAFITVMAIGPLHTCYIYP